MTTVDTAPAVSREQAIRSAEALVATDWTARSAPRLEVTVDHEGRQRLVWVHEFARTFTGPGVAQGVVIWTDAHTGTSFVQARS